MIVHLDIYVFGQDGQPHDVWRRTLWDMTAPPVPGVPYLLQSKDRQKWFFPTGGVNSGMHYDTFLDAYVVWVQFNQPVNFEHFGFTQLDRERWP